MIIGHGSFPAMTESERIKRLELAVERLCTIIRIYMHCGDPMSYPAAHRELELIKQYVRGDLESNPKVSETVPTRANY